MIKTIIFALFLIDGEPHFIQGYPPVDTGSIERCEALLAATSSLGEEGYPYKAGCFVGTVEEFKEMVDEIVKNPVGFTYPGEPA